MAGADGTVLENVAGAGLADELKAFANWLPVEADPENPSGLESPEFEPKNPCPKAGPLALLDWCCACFAMAAGSA